MKRHFERYFGLLKTTLLGGVVFLLPLMVVGALLGQAAMIVAGVVSALQDYLRENSDTIGHYVELGPLLYASVAVASSVLLVLACFAAGVFARRRLGRWFTERAERYLLMLFPRYAVFKDQLTGNLGTGTLRPVVVRLQGATRVGMEVERDASGVVTVYLPSSPDPWTGDVVILPAAEVTPIDAPSADVMATFEKLGRGTSDYVLTGPPAR
ncbi:hypothetical protein [Botrimarina sp.]|uniref:DUF502 domain-containing protein n=1 Tax=Botrimarina sp. TaxID=2795802 RepID=UPI0032ECFC3F